ncbi:MAG TPA: hypothetical protein VHN79_02135 [Lacunisphaera sp.]|nr:hypothetical protein [Lacunisphaera sp.]
MNSITIYLVAEIVRFERLAGRLVGPDIRNFFNGYLTSGAGEFLQALAGLGLTLTFAWFLHRRKIFLRV